MNSLQDTISEVDNTAHEIKQAGLKLDSLKSKGDELKEQASNLKRHNTQLQEGIIEGALNLTLESKYRAVLAEANAQNAQVIKQ